MPDLTILERVKQFLEYDSSKTQDDNLLRQLITSASVQANRYLNRHVIQTARTEYYDIDPLQQVVLLKGYPVDETATFAINNDFNREFTGSNIDSTNYDVDADTGLVTFDRYILQDGPGTLKVTYTGGMAQSVCEMAGTASGISGALAAAETVQGQTNYGRAKMIAIVSATATSFRMNILSGFFTDGETVKSETDAHSFNINTITTTPLVMDAELGAVVSLVEQQVLFDYRNRNYTGHSSMGGEGGSRGYTVPPGSLHQSIKRGLRQFRRVASY